MGEWVIQVVGEPEDLDRLSRVLTGPQLDLSPERDIFVLRSEELCPLTESREVEARGRSLVKQMNGLVRLELGPGFPRVRFGGVIKLNPGGSATFYDSATVTLHMTASAKGVVIGPDGAPVPPSPDPLLERASKSLGEAALEDAIGVYSAADDWYDLYKVYELVKKAAGGQRRVDTWSGGKQQRDRFTRTAQHYRHADEPLPPSPMTFEEADRYIATLLLAWLGE